MEYCIDTGGGNTENYEDIENNDNEEEDNNNNNNNNEEISSGTGSARNTIEIMTATKNSI